MIWLLIRVKWGYTIRKTKIEKIVNSINYVVIVLQSRNITILCKANLCLFLLVYILIPIRGIYLLSNVKAI